MHCAVALGWEDSMLMIPCDAIHMDAMLAAAGICARQQWRGEQWH